MSWLVRPWKPSDFQHEDSLSNKRGEQRALASILKLLDKDSELLDRDSHEVSLSSKLGSYLQQEFPNVDCEYNRHGNKVKTLHGEIIRPDILVHERGSDNHNLLVIEMKKTNRPDDDIETLKDMTLKDGEYHYSYGLFISFQHGEKGWTALTRWFEDGKEIGN